MAGTPEANEIAITRFYDAPVRLVWDAWTDPDQVAQWWGPRGFTLTTHSKDLRPGGSWKYTMHGPDGVDYPNTTRYIEVEPCARLVYDHGAHDDRPPLFRVTVLFTEVRGGTRMDMRMTLPTPEAAEATRKHIKEVGGNSTWDRLAEYLEKESSDRDVFVITRTFEAPIDVLFDMWTDPRHLSAWLPPTGFTMRFLKPDIRVGGTSTYSMSDGGTTTMYGRVEYLEIDRPHRIVYTQQFCDEHGQISRHPRLPVWPETLLTNVSLTPESPDRTRVTVRWEVHGTATRDEAEAFSGSKGGMTRGWSGSFDKLEAYLAEVP
ncbi:MAG TPA: SRPBCC family protein [Gemmatimonadaceae bacterium]